MIGKGVFGQLKLEAGSLHWNIVFNSLLKKNDSFFCSIGVHRVQRVPVTETSGRIHTSTATVAVLPEASDVI